MLDPIQSHTARAVPLPCFRDPRGNLCFAQEGDQLPFCIGAVRWGAVVRDKVFHTGAAIAFDGTISSGNDTADKPDIMLSAAKTFHCLCYGGTSSALIDPGLGHDTGCDVLTPSAHGKTTVDDCVVYHIPIDNTGMYRVSSDNNPAGFAIKRIYYIYGMARSSERGGHSHHREQRLLMAAAGAFNVRVFDGRNERIFRLDSPAQALYIPPGLWRTLDSFEPRSVALVLCSNTFSESDYIRDYNEFIRLTAGQKP